MSELAEKLIAENIKTKNPTLDLGNCGLDGTEDELYKPLRDARHLKTLIFFAGWLNFDLEKQKPISYLSQNQGESNNFIQIPKYIPTHITKIMIGGHSIHNPTELRILKDLKYLDFFSNQVEDIIYLKDLQNLEYLEFSSEQVQDISVLKELKKLRFLSFSFKNLQDINPLKRLINLEFLQFIRTQITDITPLKDLQNLQALIIYSNQIQDITPLKKLQNLQTLYLSMNNIESIEPLKFLINLQTLHLTSNRITEIISLKDLKCLQYLDISGNDVKNINALKELKQLQNLSLISNKIKDITPLKSLEDLQHLDTDNYSNPPIWYVYLKNKGGKIGDYKHLEELPQVEKIWQIMQNGDEENINLAHQIALGQGWTEEEFEMYQNLL